jgi:hypothetical protein
MRHHRAVSTDLHIDPIALRAAAELLQLPQLSALDAADLDVLAILPGGTVLVAEHDRLTTTITGAARELAALKGAFATVAASVELAEEAVTRSIAQT